MKDKYLIIKQIFRDGLETGEKQYLVMDDFKEYFKIEDFEEGKYSEYWVPITTLDERRLLEYVIDEDKLCEFELCITVIPIEMAENVMLHEIGRVEYNCKTIINLLYEEERW